MQLDNLYIPSLLQTIVPICTIGGLVAILVAQIMPIQFSWINRLVDEGVILAVGVSPVYPAKPERCSCGHLLQSAIEQQYGWCAECL